MTRFAWTPVTLPDQGSPYWAHPGATVAADGTLYLGAADGRSIHRIDRVGSVTTLAVPTTECHGIAVTPDGSLWIADPGRKEVLRDGVLSVTTVPGRVLLVDASGAPQRELAAPTPAWSPTAVATDGDTVWVADGYGESLVHAFDARGTLLWTTDATASGTAFATPHGLVVDRRGVEARLLVADRGNRRIVCLTLDGRFLGSFGSDVLTSPSGLAIAGDTLWVSELFGAVVGLDPDARVIARIGEAPEPVETGWPNGRDGDTVTAPDVPFAQFRSPHGIAALPTGEVFVAEWVIGGRATILTPA